MTLGVTGLHIKGYTLPTEFTGTTHLDLDVELIGTANAGHDWATTIINNLE